MIKAHYSRVARSQWNPSGVDVRRQFRPEFNREADFTATRTPISRQIDEVEQMIDSGRNATALSDLLLVLDLDRLQFSKYPIHNFMYKCFPNI
ncbi:unnamed protein product [Lasius platythorax]|uniref:Uncharacterized protein n=1 Tax=Lasius platythorax TaxID=488582 RepID=A0AAV2NWV6_9HYME